MQAIEALTMVQTATLYPAVLGDAMPTRGYDNNGALPPLFWRTPVEPGPLTCSC